MKKKRIIVLLIIGLLVLTVISCGGPKDSPEAPADTETTQTEETAEPEEESDSEDADSAILSPDFKKTMDDYEAWFDHYCEVMKKYQDNPSDMELLSEMSDLMVEETAMLEQMEDMDESEMNTAELAYYIEVTARIEKKLLELGDY